MKFQVTFGVVYLLIAVAMIAGWTMNLCAVIGGFVHDVPLTTQFILRVIGIPVAPLGTILGYF